MSAKIVFRDNRPTIRPSRTGVTVSPQAWVAGVQRAFVKTGDRRTARVKPTVDKPKFSTGQVERLGIRSLIAAKTVNYTEGDTVGDPTIVARQLNGVLLLPGDTLRFGRRVDWRGQPRAASLLASATYDVAFRSGMTVVKRTSSPFYSPQFTAGLDAVVSQRSETLVLRNDGPYGAYLRAYVDLLRNRTGTLHVELWSTPYVTVTLSSSDRYNVINPLALVDESAGCTPRAGSPGFEIDVTRTLKRASGPGRTERTHTRYSPLAAIVCG
ncbi:MAG: VanW family protein [Nocardioidaceae bacterium]|nr:VanW family protein [Nocardioidaceae bacterium]